jgi:hypothetical protein
LPVLAFETTAITKPPLIESLALAFERGEITILNDGVLTGELSAYERTVSPRTGHSQRQWDWLAGHYSDLCSNRGGLMKEYQTLKVVNAKQLGGELRAALPERIVGVSTYGPDVPISVWLDDATTDNELATVAAVVAAHVPDFTRPPDALIQAWQAIQAQTADRPLANMDFDQVKAWIAANVTDAKTQTAFINIAEELFIVRAQVAILVRALAYLFNQWTNWRNQKWTSSKHGS